MMRVALTGKICEYYSALILTDVQASYTRLKGYIFIENSLLTESPENSDIDVTDPFLSECPLFADSDSIKFSIKETAKDVSSI